MDENPYRAPQTQPEVEREVEQPSMSGLTAVNLTGFALILLGRWWYSSTVLTVAGVLLLLIVAAPDMARVRKMRLQKARQGARSMDESPYKLPKESNEQRWRDEPCPWWVAPALLAVVFALVSLDVWKGFITIAYAIYMVALPLLVRGVARWFGLADFRPRVWHKTGA